MREILPTSPDSVCLIAGLTLTQIDSPTATPNSCRANSERQQMVYWGFYSDRRYASTLTIDLTERAVETIIRNDEIPFRGPLGG